MKPEDRCALCGHAYAWHARGIEHTTERCWHGAATGDGCPLECKQFVPEKK